MGIRSINNCKINSRHRLRSSVSDTLVATPTNHSTLGRITYIVLVLT